MERIDVTPDLTITMEEEEEDGEEEEEEDEEDRPVSPPACHLAPILVPNGSFPSSLMAAGNQLDPEERRRRRNREASRRYRERARGDPELLRRMREQQNRYNILPHTSYSPSYLPYCSSVPSPSLSHPYVSLHLLLLFIHHIIVHILPILFRIPYCLTVCSKIL